jgi:hypothetical protein
MKILNVVYDAPKYVHKIIYSVHLICCMEPYFQIKNKN